KVNDQEEVKKVDDQEIENVKDQEIKSMKKSRTLKINKSLNDDTNDDNEIESGNFRENESQKGLGLEVSGNNSMAHTRKEPKSTTLLNHSLIVPLISQSLYHQFLSLVTKLPILSLTQPPRPLVGENVNNQELDDVSDQDDAENINKQAVDNGGDQEDAGNVDDKEKVDKKSDNVDEQGDGENDEEKVENIEDQQVKKVNN
nr:hypothetical protein [Tanacetum cinerariifolium]